MGMKVVRFRDGRFGVWEDGGIVEAHCSRRPRRFTTAEAALEWIRDKRSCRTEVVSASPEPFPEPLPDLLHSLRDLEPVE